MTDPDPAREWAERNFQKDLILESQFHVVLINFEDLSGSAV